MEKKFDRFAIGRKLSPVRRNMFHQAGARWQSVKTHQYGFLADADDCHEDALWALETINWHSVNAAVALLKVGRC